MSHYLHPDECGSAPCKDNTSVPNGISESTDHTFARVPAPIPYTGLPVRTAVLFPHLLSAPLHHLLNKRTKPVSQELSPPPPLNRDQLLSLIQEQIRLNNEQEEARRERDRREDAAKLDKEIAAADIQFSTLEAKLKRERIADVEELKQEKEDMQDMFSALDSRMTALENGQEQRAADWSNELSVLKAQLEETVLLNRDLEDFRRVSHQYY